MRILRGIIVCLAGLVALSARADQTSQRTTYGMSLSLQGQLVDLNAPICSPAAGSYSVAYRNSIATGCTGRASDDFATLVFSGGSAATYTMPASTVTTFTGSISGTTLTTPSNAVTIGSVITDPGSGKVLDNTYVTAGSGTSWTVNNSQTVASETLTQSVFPPGHGTCFKNLGTALLTLAATTSLILPASGVVNGNPLATGGPIVLYPEGEVCLQANTSNNYLPSGFVPGAWFQGAPASTPVSSFSYTGLSGYTGVHLSCRGISVGTNGSYLLSQLAYAGSFQTTGYTYQIQQNYIASQHFETDTNGTGFLLSEGLDTSANDAADLDADFSFEYGAGLGFSNAAKANSRFYDTYLASESLFIMSGSAPLTTSQAVTGVNLFPNAGTMSGSCWLTPRTGSGP